MTQVDDALVRAVANAMIDGAIRVWSRERGEWSTTGVYELLKRAGERTLSDHLRDVCVCSDNGGVSSVCGPACRTDDGFCERCAPLIVVPVTVREAVLV